MAEGKEVVTLEVSKGKNYDKNGEVIGSYGRSIVFLPRAQGIVKPGQSVRVALVDTGRVDRNSRTMYEGQHAPVEYSDSWKDNGDGTVSRYTVATDWKFAKTVADEASETRPLGTRDGSATVKETWAVVWGNDLNGTWVTNSPIRVVPLESERISGEALYWQKTGERGEPQPQCRYQATAVEVNPGWDKTKAVYPAEMQVTARVTYASPAANQRDITCKWGDLPAWAQAEVEAKYPLCSCGRERVDAEANKPYGDYPNCKKCLADAPCVRCGKASSGFGTSQGKGFPLHLGSGQVVCLACWPAYEQEAKASAIPVAKLEELGAMARELAGGQAIEGVGGEAILRATLGHVEQPHRDWWLREWAGYPWYYFTDHGVYGSKLAPAALQILQYLPQAAGSSQLAELLFWLSGYHKLEDIKNRGDYYWKTQVEGKTATPSLDMEKLVVAIRLRGSEADRQAVLVWLAKTADSSDGRLETARNRIQKLMQESEQDYALALAEIAEFEIVQATRQARAEAGEIWLDARVDVSSRSRVISSVWCFAPDGSEVKGAEVWSGSGRKADLIAYDFGDLATDHLVVAHAHDNYGYRYSEDWTVNFLPKRVTAEQERAVRAAEPHQYFAGTGTGWVLSKKGTVAFTTQYHRDLVEGSEEYEAHQRMVSQNPIQVDEWEVLPGEGTWVVWARERSATPALRKWKEDLRQTEQVEANAMYMYANLEGERNRVATAYDEAVLAVLERDEANFGTSPVAQGTIFEVEFHPEDRQGQTQLVTNPIWDNPSGSWIKLVEDPFSGRRPAPGKNLVRVRAKNSQQVALFQYRTQNPDGPNGSGGRMVTVFGYFASVVLSPEYLEAEIAVAEKQMLDLKDLADHLRANQPKENGKAKKASKPPTRVVATFGDGEDLENSMEVAFAEALRKANGEGKN